MTCDSSVKTVHAVLDRKTFLSTLWIFAGLNYVYADVFSMFFEADALERTEVFGGMAVLCFDVLMEIAIVMVPLAIFLQYRANRAASIIAGVIHTVSVAAVCRNSGTFLRVLHRHRDCLHRVCHSVRLDMAPVEDQGRQIPACGRANRK